MIYDSLKHMEAYQGVHPGIYKGLELLRDTDFSKLEDAGWSWNGEDLFYLLQSYESKPANVHSRGPTRSMWTSSFCLRAGEDGGRCPGGHEGRGGGPPGAGYLVLPRPLDEITLGGDKFVVLFPGMPMPPTSRWTDLSLYASAW